MSELPSVSIIIITMNHEKFIEQACISAATQDYPNLEIVLLDNASEDNTFVVAQNTLAKYPVKNTCIRNEKSYGVAKNLNILVSRASGEYISILSGDDWYTQDNISEKIKFVSENSVDFVLSDGLKYYQETGETTDAYTSGDKKNLLKNVSDFFYYNVAENKTVNVGTFLRKDLLVENPFDEDIQTEDWDMNLRFSFKGYKFGFLDKKLFYYRILPTSLSRNWAVMKNSYEKVTGKYLDYIQKHKTLHQRYLLNMLQFKYEILLGESKSAEDRKNLLYRWKVEKYRIKYKNPLLFIKLILLKK